MKFFSDEYFKEVASILSSDSIWKEDVKKLKTSVMLVIADQGTAYLVTVDSGKSTVQKVNPDARAELTFEGSYDTWVRIGKREIQPEAAVIGGSLKFKGSIVKVLSYRGRVTRMLDVILDGIDSSF